MNSSTGVTRDKRNALIGGVCAGLARHFGWSVMGTRVVYVLADMAGALVAAMEAGLSA